MAASPDTSPDVIYGLLAIRPGDPIAGTAVTFDLYDEFDRETYDRYSSAYERVADAYDGDLSIYSTAALEQLRSLAAQVEELAANMSSGALTAARSSWHTTLVGAVLMFCASTHLYQEQTEAAVARHFGSESAEHHQIRQRFRDAYDSSLGYRVIYRLRNVLVHHSMKSIGFHLEAHLERDPEGRERPVARLRMPLVRATFIEARKNVSATIRTELAALDADPDIRELGRDAIDAIADLRRDSMELIHPNLPKDCSTVNELSDRFPPWSEADRALVKLSFKGGVPQFPHMALRAEIFEYAATTVPGDG